MQLEYFPVVLFVQRMQKPLYDRKFAHNLDKSRSEESFKKSF